MIVVVFGDLPIATKVCSFLQGRDEVKLVGVVIGNENPTNNDPWSDVPLLKDYAESNNIERLTLDELAAEYNKNSLDMGFSCRFSKIFKKEHIDLFKNGIVNFHGGLLPEFGGLYSSCHTILEGAEVGGGTLHYIDECIDTGEIIARAEVPISDRDTSFTIFQNTQRALFQKFTEVFEDLIRGNIKPKKMQDFLSEGYRSEYYDKDSLDGKKELSLSDSPELIDKKVRAFDFPGKEPAYFKILNNKYYLRTTFK